MLYKSLVSGYTLALRLTYDTGALSDTSWYVLFEVTVPSR